MKDVTKIKHAGMLRVFVVAALVLLFAAAGVGAVSAAVPAGFPTGTTTDNPNDAVVKITRGTDEVYYTAITAIMTSGGDVPTLPEDSEVELLKDVSVNFLHNSVEASFKLDNNVTFDIILKYHNELFPSKGINYLCGKGFHNRAGKGHKQY